MKIKFNRLTEDVKKIMKYLINKIKYSNPCDILQKYNLDKIKFEDHHKYIYKHISNLDKTNKYYVRCNTLLKKWNFIASGIIEYFSENINSLIIYKIKSNIRIFIYDDMTDHYHLINICKWIFDDNIYYNSRIAFDIHIILSPFDKFIDFNKKESPLSADNINTGACEFTSVTKRTIVLYRQADLEKVLIHEIIHGMDIDHKSIDHSHRLAVKLGSNNYKILINEGITECLAIYLYDYYLVKYMIYNRRIKHDEDLLIYNYFNLLMISDISINIINAANILKYYNITSIRNLLDINTFQQNTNVYSYIFIRLMLLIDENIIVSLFDKKIDNKIIKYLDNFIINRNYITKLINCFIKKNDYDGIYNLYLSNHKLN
jgi:hypothetical protein